MLSLLPPDGLRRCRARFDLDGPDALDILQNDVEGNPIDEATFQDGRTVGEHMQDEVRAAIQTRIAERES